MVNLTLTGLAWEPSLTLGHGTCKVHYISLGKAGKVTTTEVPYKLRTGCWRERDWPGPNWSSPTAAKVKSKSSVQISGDATRHTSAWSPSAFQYLSVKAVLTTPHQSVIGWWLFSSATASREPADSAVVVAFCCCWFFCFVLCQCFCCCCCCRFVLWFKKGGEVGKWTVSVWTERGRKTKTNKQKTDDEEEDESWTTYYGFFFWAPPPPPPPPFFFNGSGSEFQFIVLKNRYSASVFLPSSMIFLVDSLGLSGRPAAGFLNMKTCHIQFSSVQFSSRWYLCALRNQKNIRAPPGLSKVSPTLPLKKFQCSSDWRWPFLVCQLEEDRRALLLSTPLSFRRLMVGCPWLPGRR